MPIIKQTPLGAKLPLAESSVTQYQTVNNYVEMARQNLKMLVLTIPGERIMDVNFGVGLPTYLFELNNLGVRQSINSKLQEQVGIYLPYVKIVNVEYNSSIEDPTISEHFLSIKISFSIPPIGINTSLELSVSGETIDDISAGEISSS